MDEIVQPDELKCCHPSMISTYTSCRVARARTKWQTARLLLVNFGARATVQVSHVKTDHYFDVVDIDQYNVVATQFGNLVILHHSCLTSGLRLLASDLRPLYFCLHIDLSSSPTCLPFPSSFCPFV